MKFLEISNIKIPLSNEEEILYNKIKKQKQINLKKLNEREKILIYSLLCKNLVSIKKEKNIVTVYC